MPRPIAHGKNLLPPGLVAVRIELDGACARFVVGPEDTSEIVKERVERVLAWLGHG